MNSIPFYTFPGLTCGPIRFAADIFTEGLMLLARSINPSAPTLFHASLSPHARAYKVRGGRNGNGSPPPLIDTTPKKLEWKLSPELRVGIRYAETRLSDLICQNDCQALEFKAYGKNFITSHGFSPDAFVQMAFQAAYYGLYGRIECTYEPAMTKAFLHGVGRAGHRCRRVARIYFLDARRLVASCAGRAGCVRGTKRRKCAVDYRRHTVCWRE